MKSKDEILASLYYVDSLKPTLLYNGTIRSYFDKIIRSSNAKNIPKSVTLLEQWQLGNVKEGIYAYYSGPTIRANGKGRNDWGVVVIQKRKKDFFYAVYAKLFHIENGSVTKKGEDFINLNKRVKYISQYEYIRDSGQRDSNTAELTDWCIFKSVEEGANSTALTAQRVINIHKPLKLGKMMNWGTLESLKE